MSNNARKSQHLFFSMLKNPRLTGSVIPSSKYLADVMSKAAKNTDKIIELGAGTGAITKVLLKQHPTIPLVAVEYQEQLALELRQMFPQLEVEHSTAKDVLDRVCASDEKITIISALPFRSLPPEVSALTIDSILNLLERCPQAKLIQFTYFLTAPFDLSESQKEHYYWRMIDSVWLNIPPATVWELCSSQ